MSSQGRVTYAITVVEFMLFDLIYPPTPTGTYLAEGRQKHKVIYLLNTVVTKVIRSRNLSERRNNYLTE